MSMTVSQTKTLKGTKFYFEFKSILFVVDKQMTFYSRLSSNNKTTYIYSAKKLLDVLKREGRILDVTYFLVLVFISANMMIMKKY